MADEAMNGLTGPRLADLLRRGGANVVVCVSVALLLTAMPGGSFVRSLVYSLAIGILCWLAIDGGRLLVARALWKLDATRLAAYQGWPGWGWMSLLVVVGTGAGLLLGTLMAETILGEASPRRAIGGMRAPVFVVLVSITASAIATGYFYARGRLASLQAEAEAARRTAAETQLKLLESQLEPHMLFNTLANLRVLIGSDPPRAQVMLDRMIAFLRATLNASRSGAMHPLAAEFERLADYLALMAVRMGPRLAVRLDLPDELRSVAVPPLLLQPLVENAIRHGLEPKIAGGRIEISARRRNDRLLLTVRDSGVGLGGAAIAGTRFGLQQVRERLAATFGSAASLVIEAAHDDDDGGTVARIECPLDEAVGDR